MILYHWLCLWARTARGPCGGRSPHGPLLNKLLKSVRSAQPTFSCSSWFWGQQFTYWRPKKNIGKALRCSGPGKCTRKSSLGRFSWTDPDPSHQLIHWFWFCGRFFLMNVPAYASTILLMFLISLMDLYFQPIDGLCFSSIYWFCQSDAKWTPKFN